MSDMIVGAIMGALAMCAVGLGAAKLGLIRFGSAQEQEEPTAAPVRRVYPRLGCSVTVEAKNDSNSSLMPQVRLFATVENEGEIVVRALKGHWRVVTPDKYKHPSVRILRDVLAPKDKYLESYLLDATMEAQGEGIRFDVEVEFDYMAQADYESRHYSAKYRYDRKYHRMVKL